MNANIELTCLSHRIHRLMTTLGCIFRNHPVEMRISLTVIWTQWFVSHDAKMVWPRFFFLCNTFNIYLRSLLRHFLKKRVFPFPVCLTHTHSHMIYCTCTELELVQNETRGNWRNDIHHCSVIYVRPLIEEIFTAWHQIIKSFTEDNFSSH